MRIQYEMPGDRMHEIRADLMVRLETYRNDGCHVGLWNLPNGMVKVCLYSPFEGNEPVTGDTIPATELIQWLADHQDW
jgi:hypothetical protein